jgi:hypothetical protein
LKPLAGASVRGRSRSPPHRRSPETEGPHRAATTAEPPPSRLPDHSAKIASQTIPVAVAPLPWPSGPARPAGKSASPARPRSSIPDWHAPPRGLRCARTAHSLVPVRSPLAPEVPVAPVAASPPLAKRISCRASASRSPARAQVRSIVPINRPPTGLPWRSLPCQSDYPAPRAHPAQSGALRDHQCPHGHAPPRATRARTSTPLAAVAPMAGLSPGKRDYPAPRARPAQSAPPRSSKPGRAGAARAHSLDVPSHKIP